MREVRVVSGLPAENSTERLNDLDDICHVMRFSIIGEEHRLANYQSTLTLHELEGGDTVAIESYVVDVPTGCTGEETCLFTDTIVRCNIRSLAHVTEVMALFST
ncbi:abscisic acid receptor PYL11-like protein [Cinnamomum micranthum f. kanehirae]|uniref:Abscisic acid receptor PYL11-like protein n=1 Tax=Cinnamomum micranthum f. kanehirae TaxID=337451 RepID=A0A443PZZ4_9MAGN|nr:abscisic acid receptor PYL11-like protein [Cinnamomum micranthum f. kanehirae]